MSSRRSDDSAEAQIPIEVQLRLLGFLHDELKRACQEALARGVNPDELARDLARRAEGLQATTAQSTDASSPHVLVAENVEHRLDDVIDATGIA